MSLRNKLILRTVLTSLFLSLLTIVIFLFIAFFHIERSVRDTYESVSRAYASILKTLSRSSDDVVFKLRDCKVRSANTYLILGEEGLLVGRVDECVFYGTTFKKVIEFTVNIHRLQWLIVYDREVLERFVRSDPEFFDRFIRDRVVLNDYVLEGFFTQKILNELSNLTGYSLIDGYRTLLMDFPILLEGSVPVGRLVLVKDFSGTLKEVLLTPFLFLGYTLVLVLILSTILFFSFDSIVRDISMLRRMAYRFKELDFSDVQKLSDMLRKEKSRDELYYLKRSILTMAQELEALIDQLQKEKEKLEELAYTDPLTGLSNRRFFLEELKRHLEISKRYGEPLSVIMIDVDNFKRINDEYGHDIGDMVLKNLAEVVKKNIRSSDIAARFGGEEFIIALPKTDERGALMVAERIRKDFKNSKVEVDGKLVGTTVSLGVATFSGSEDMDRLIKEADEALYEAKRTGKDKVVVRKGEPQGKD